MESHQYMSASTVLRYFEYFLCYFCLHTTFLREVSFFFYSSLRFQSQNMRSFHKTWLPRYQLSYFRWPIAPRLIDTDGKLTFPSVYWPLKDLYNTHIHPFIHRWQECEEPTCSSGESKGSVPCSRILRHPAGGAEESNRQPFWLLDEPLYSLSSYHPIQSSGAVSLKLLGEAVFGHISMLSWTDLHDQPVILCN